MMRDVRCSPATPRTRDIALPLAGVAIAIGVTWVSAACFVDVDEGLIDEAARKRDAQSAADGTSDALALSDVVTVDAVASDANVIEAGPYPGLTCGSTFCTPPGEVCCTKTFGDPDIRNGACSTRSLCQTGDWFACATARDCSQAGLGDQQCCVVRASGAFTKTECAATCKTDQDTLCANDGKPCPGTSTCAPSTEFPSLFQCRVQ